MRKYQLAWSVIQKQGTLKILADPSIHNRIIKAISKEKYMDLAYKNKLELRNKSARLYSQSKATEIVFNLVTYTGGIPL